MTFMRLNKDTSITFSTAKIRRKLGYCAMLWSLPKPRIKFFENFKGALLMRFRRCKAESRASSLQSEVFLHYFTENWGRIGYDSPDNDSF